MPKLGVNVINRSAPAASGNLTSTNQAFLVGLSDQGLANTPVVCQSIQDYQSAFGARSTTNTTLYDSVDVYFREGGSQAVVSRVVGPSPVNGTVTLLDNTNASTLLVTAKYPGAYANGYQVVITKQSSQYTITITDSSGNTLESNSGLTTRAEAISASWKYVNITATGSSTLPPASTQISEPVGLAAATATSGGTLTAETEYFYVVTAVNAEGETVASSEVSKKTTSANKTIPLTWTAVSGATGYNVYRATVTGGEVLYSSPSTNSYTDSGSGTVGTQTPPTKNTTGVQALSGGTDNRTAITGGAVSTAWGNALAGFSKSLGSGQVAAPGQTSIVVQTLLANHAEANDRAVAWDLGTFTGNNVESQLAAALAPISALANASEGAAFAGNLTAPGVVPGTIRSIPASAVACALAARGDATGSPNVAPCGLSYPLIYCTGTDTDLSDSDREALFNAGGNCFHFNYGVLSLYGWQTPVSASVDQVFDQFNHTRTRMAIVAQSNLIGANYQFSDIDGKGTVFTALQGDLSAMLSNLWSVGALYGDTAGDAFSVDVGSSVNTPTTIANQEIRAVVSVRLSPYASYVQIELVSVPTTQTLSA